MIQSDQDTEIRILRAKLTETEDKLAAVNGAAIEMSFLMYNAMRKLLKANDVKADRAMGINIKEIMNDAGRQAVDLFYSKGLIPCGSREMWPPFKKSTDASDNHGR